MAHSPLSSRILGSILLSASLFSYGALHALPAQANSATGPAYAVVASLSHAPQTVGLYDEGSHNSPVRIGAVTKWENGRFVYIFDYIINTPLGDTITDETVGTLPRIRGNNITIYHLDLQPTDGQSQQYTTRYTQANGLRSTGTATFWNGTDVRITATMQEQASDEKNWWLGYNRTDSAYYGIRIANIEANILPDSDLWFTVQVSNASDNTTLDSRDRRPDNAQSLFSLAQETAHNQLATLRQNTPAGSALAMSSQNFDSLIDAQPDSASMMDLLTDYYGLQNYFLHKDTNNNTAMYPVPIRSKATREAAINWVSTLNLSEEEKNTFTNTIEKALVLPQISLALDQAYAAHLITSKQILSQYNTTENNAYTEIQVSPAVRTSSWTSVFFSWLKALFSFFTKAS